MKSCTYFFAMCLFVSATAHAQVLKRVTKKAGQSAERTLERKVEQKTAKETGRAIDSVFEAPKKVSKKEGSKKEDQQGQTSEARSQAGAQTQPNPAPSRPAGPTLVTGSTFFPDGNLLFSEDFTGDASGDFPARWETNAGGEVIAIGEQKALRLYPNGIYLFNSAKLPDNYALDFDLTTDQLDYQGLSGSGFFVELTNEKSLEKTPMAGARFGFSLWKRSDIANRVSVENWGKGVSKIQNTIDYRMSEHLNGTVHLTVVVNGKRLRVYINHEKVIDLPSLLQADAGRQVRFALRGTNKTLNHVVAIHNVKVTEEGEDLRSLLLKGGFSTTKILFNSGSDQLKPESFSFLQKLGKTLEQDPSLRVLIIGHTDSDGDAVKNMTLSKARAFSVGNYLIDTLGIEKSRLVSQGRGENEPVADNATEEGKAQNRRVEFKKL